MPVTTHGDARIHWEARGRGRPILLIGGFASDANFWDAQRPLEETYRLVTFDHRGIGRSAAPIAMWSTATLMGDALGVLDAAGVERAHVVGHSMGGAVALALALDHPERVDHLVLVATFARGPRAGSYRTGQWPDILEALGVDAYVDAVLGWCVAAPTFEARPGWVDGMRRRLREALGDAPLDPHVLRAQRRVIASHDRTGELGRVASPTCVIVGDGDILTPPFWSVELATNIPGARLVRVEGAGHLLPLEDPMRFNAILDGFFGSAQLVQGA